VFAGGDPGRGLIARQPATGARIPRRASSGQRILPLGVELRRRANSMRLGAERSFA
jgi:hypothetical protein